MLRILHVSDAYYPFPGGVTEHIHHLVTHLRRLGHDARILTARYPGDYTDPEWVHRVGRIHILPPLRILNATQLTLTFSPHLLAEVREFFSSYEFDIIHTHGPFAFNLPFLALHYGKGTHVATFHTAFVGFNWNKVAKTFFRFYARKVRLCIAVSEVAKTAMSEHYPCDYRIVPNGIDTERFCPEGDLPGDKVSRPIVLYVGRMEPRKGFPLLLEAFKLVKKLIPSATLVAIGTGPQLESYKKSVPEGLIDSVVFKGFVTPEELPLYYRWADVYVSPAIGGETFGIVLLEAMASGTPVVASNIPGYAQVITHNENGILVDPHNTERLADKIIRVLNDRGFMDKLVQNGLLTARKYSWSKVAQQLESLYYEILEL